MFWDKKCSICGMKEEKDSGVKKDGKWFCSQDHADQYNKKNNNSNVRHKCCG